MCLASIRMNKIEVKTYLKDIYGITADKVSTSNILGESFRSDVFNPVFVLFLIVIGNTT